MAVDDETEDVSDRLAHSRPVKYAVESADSYLLLLILLITLSLLAPLLSGNDLGKVLLGLMLCSVALLALWTSRVRAGALKLAAVGAVIVIAAILAEVLTDVDSFSRLARASLILLVVAMPVVIGARIMRHPVVTGETVMGAICVYLLVGLVFSIGYQLIDKIDEAAFATVENGDWPDLQYFSFVTLTTLGYGDITPTGDFARSVAVLEAVVGNVFLVTLVASLVGNLGRQRQRQERRPQQSQGPAHEDGQPEG